MQYFKSISFKTIEQCKSKIVTVSFTEDEQNIFDMISKLSSLEIRQIIKINNYEELLDLSSKEQRSLSQIIKILFKRYTNGKTKNIAASDVTFKNSKLIPFQRWYPYIEGYSIDFVKNIIENNLNRKCIIYEPFAGTGTTIFASDQMGFDTFYSEINPLLLYLIETKINVLKTPYDVRIKLANKIKENSLELIKFQNEEDECLRQNYKSVFKDSKYFEDENFAKVLKAKSFLNSIENQLVRDVITIAVLASLIPSSLLKKQGDLRFKNKKELEKGIPHFEEVFLLKIDEICEDLNKYSNIGINKNHTCVVQNAKNIGRVNCEKIGCVITSPPYLNGTNYIRNTKLELWFIGALSTSRDLRTFRDEILTSGINDVKIIGFKESCLEERSTIYKDTIKELSEHAYDKRIPLMAKCYFSEMFSMFEGLSLKLEDNADVFIDIGDSIFNDVHIKTDLILQDLLSSIGFKTIKNTKLRSRRSRNGKDLSQVLIHLKYDINRHG